MRSRCITLLCALALVAPASASAEFLPGGPAPAICTGAFWTDLVGTAASDLVVGHTRPQRIYGLSDADFLVGSHTRASCLFGGTGSDSLYLGRGGGVVLGEEGRDLLMGSAMSDALTGGPSGDVLVGGDADDVVRGDEAVDTLHGGAGADVVLAQDGLAEVVDCGEGDDLAYADRADVLFGCEGWKLDGPPLRQKRLGQRSGRTSTVFRGSFTAPIDAAAGRFKVLVAGARCGAPVTAWSSPAVRRGRVIGMELRPPEGGWCRGPHVGALIRENPCPPQALCPAASPATPLAWLAFGVRR